MELAVLHHIGYDLSPQSVFILFYVFPDWLIMITAVTVFLFAFYPYYFTSTDIFICICNECRMIVISLIGVK